MIEASMKVRSSAVAPQANVPDRITPVIELAKGKKVLNIGCCGSDALTSVKTVHRRIAEVASRCVGIDIYEDGIKKMQADGEEVYLANAESFDINIKDFDLVVLGDIIEHVSNPGLVLDNANRHLHDEGILFVTTPNPFSIAMFLKILVRGGYNVNSEHVTWFDPVLLSFLLDRSGFKSAQLLWTGPSKHSILRFLLSFRSDLRADFGIVGKKFRSIATKTNETRIEII